MSVAVHQSQRAKGASPVGYPPVERALGPPPLRPYFGTARGSGQRAAAGPEPNRERRLTAPSLGQRQHRFGSRRCGRALAAAPSAAKLWSDLERALDSGHGLDHQDHLRPAAGSRSRLQPAKARPAFPRLSYLSDGRGSLGPGRGSASGQKDRCPSRATRTVAAAGEPARLGAAVAAAGRLPFWPRACADGGRSARERLSVQAANDPQAQRLDPALGTTRPVARRRPRLAGPRRSTATAGLEPQPARDRATPLSVLGSAAAPRRPTAAQLAPSQRCDPGV